MRVSTGSTAALPTMFLPVAGVRTLALALACTLASALFTWLVLTPAIGFDDANITLAYAENIAAGHGYVYNIGGERVEGSTSPLWTAVTTLAFLLPYAPETTLAVLGLLIAWATVWQSMRLGETAFALAGLDARGAALPVGLGFLALPAVFGWTVWSLMDFGFWVLLTVVAIRLVVALALGRSEAPVAAGLAAVAALLAVTRPEGVAVALAFGLLAALLGGRDGRRAGALAAASGVLAFGAVALLRFAYFGDIFPNTYYAKVSTDHVSQLAQGVDYLVGFLSSPVNAGILGLAALLPLSGAVRARRASLGRAWAATLLAVAGGMALYVLIGGDHFGSWRFFLFAYPALLPFAALALRLLWDALPARRRHPAAPWLLAAALLVATSASFAVHKGNYVRELRIAEQGREMGRILNRLPGAPSIAIVAAGGIAMTYEGHIYDLLGLNWVEMARADRDQVGAYVNHGGFSKAVFYDTLPEIVHPQFGACDRAAYDGNRFFGKVLRGLLAEPEFQSLYRFECFEGLRFYRRVG